MDLHAVFVKALDKLVGLQKKAQPTLNEIPVVGAIAGGLTVCGTAWYLYHVISHKMKQSRKDAPLPPGPLPLPLIGSLQKVVKHFGPDGNPRIHRGLGDLAEEYGPVFGLYMGSYYTVVISDPKLAHEAFIKVSRHQVVTVKREN